ncbi:MAG: helix-turn-helix domain-containing protein [Anaerolineales bacterium]|uniref:Helix-turn-helix domain-containing protein n=1 Tax=Candidatus Desulfolinea nitratireducens TaxID=2841698 RepID=A0A8J6TKR8_9CHLR|nr:helix-turn-helix domain-containing protein [Candidatus Desulfolinea nitratireducens]MBL6960579.1 helix-turn-helix domain-containing protein [Anaerolineales bacterium]
MNHSEYLLKLKKNTKYQNAKKALKPNFDLGNAIIRARIKKGWSQTELAKQAGTKQANISRIEDASANPTFKTVQCILSALGIETHYSPVGIPIHIWPIRTEEDYEETLIEIDNPQDAELETPEDDKLKVLSILVDTYESENEARTHVVLLPQDTFYINTSQKSSQTDNQLVGNYYN